MTRIISFLTAFFLLSPATAKPFVDAAGRTVEIPATVNRVLAAGPPAQVMIYVLAPEKLVGWVREPTAAEKEFLAPPARDLATIGRLTGRGNTANLETILAAKADLIVDVGTVDDTFASLADRIQQQTGVPYILVDGRFPNSAASLRTLGAVLGVEARGDELARDAEATFAELAKRAALPADKRTRVYYGRGPKGLETGMGGSINAELIEVAGGINVAAAAGNGGLTTVSLEQVLSWKPDVILALDPAFQAGVLQDPLWASVPAVKNKKVFRAPAVPFGWFDFPPGINRLIGLRWLDAVLYPDRASGDLRKMTRDFYSRYYHVALTDAQLDTLLRDALKPPA